MRGLVADVITDDKFCRDRLRGFWSGGSENGGLPLTWAVALTTGEHYYAACDVRLIWFWHTIRVH